MEGLKFEALKDDEIAENQHMRIVVDPASDSESLHLPEGDEDSEPEVPSGTEIKFYPHIHVHRNVQKKMKKGVI